MGFFSKYLVSFLIIFMASTLLFSSIVSTSTAPDVQDITMNSTFQDDITQAQEELMNVSLVDSQVDPNSDTDVASWFGKSLAIAGKVVNLLATTVSGSLQFVASILSNISNLPAPWNIIGSIISLGLAVLAVLLSLKLLAVIVKVDL